MILTRLGFVCLLVFYVCAQTTGGHRGPCSALPLPGPFSEPVTLFGTTVGAEPSTGNLGCPETDDDDILGGVAWYSITPSSGVGVTVSSCNSYTSYNSLIAVFSGSCEALTCLTAVDDADCNISSTFAIVNFASEGEIYFIAVTGYSSAGGQFELTISESNTTTVSTCETAIRIPGPYTTPVLLYGNNLFSAGSSQSGCNFNSGSKINWYLISPQTYNQVEISTCSPMTNFDTQIAVLSGSCNSLSCLEFNDDNCTTASGAASGVSFTAVLSSYYVAVYGYGTASGNYELRISEQRFSTPGDDCGTSILLPFTPGRHSTYFGSTQGNIMSSTVACGPVNSPSYWYRVDVPATYNGRINATTCNVATNYDTILFVYSGSCSNLICVTQNDDNCSQYLGSASTVFWTHNSGNVPSSSLTSTPRPTSSPAPSPIRTATPPPGTSTYFIQVAGYGLLSGEFELTLSFQ